MADINFGLGDLAYKGVSYKTKPGTETMGFRVFGGSVYFSINNQKDFHPIFNRSLNSACQTVIVGFLKEILGASPKSRRSYSLTTYDKQQNKQVFDYAFAIEKDDQNLVSIKVKWANNEYEAVIKGPFGMSFGANELTPAERSAIGVKSLISWFEHDVPIQSAISNRKRDFTNGSGGGQGGGRGGSSSSSGSIPSDESYF